MRRTSRDADVVAETGCRIPILSARIAKPTGPHQTD
jgi:hypothetical protein